MRSKLRVSDCQGADYPNSAVESPFPSSLGKGRGWGCFSLNSPLVGERARG